jgi:cytochrome P450
VTDFTEQGAAATSTGGIAGDSFPLPRAFPFGAPEQYTVLQEEPAISKVTLRTGTTVWWATRYDDVRDVLFDPRFSSDRRSPDYPRLSPIQGLLHHGPPPMVTLDGEEHAAARRAVSGEFTVRRMNALRPRIREIVSSCIDQMMAADGPVDLVATLAMPMPSLVMCELLGVPQSDHSYFQHRTVQLVRHTSGVEQAATAFAELRGYLDRLVVGKETDPRDDLLSRQIARHRQHGTYDHESMVMLAIFLMVAGHETTANMISLGVLALLTHPDQLAYLQADPNNTATPVEELLRYGSITDGIPRVAVESAEVGGVSIKVGEGIVVSSLAANRDPKIFPSPEELDLARSGARHHVAFGYGPHQCLGQNLVRVELQTVLETLFRRVPNLRLAAKVEDLPYRTDSTEYGLYELPVTW